MNVVFHHAWMQKHPTPTNASGDFHWHPAGVPDAIRTTLSDLGTRTRGQAASVWIIDDSYVAWARAFAAVSPSDRRRYTGLAVTIAQGDASAWSRALPEVMARMPLAEAGPYAGQIPGQAVRIDDMPGATEPLAVDPGTLVSLFDAGDRGLAAALYLGGQVACRDPHAERLPALIGRLLTWLPERERTRPRTGIIAASHGDERHAASMDNLLHYLATAWFCPELIRRRQPGFAAQAWQLVFDLAAGAGCTLPELFADLTAVAAAWDTAENLRRHLVQRGALSEHDIAACDQRAPSPLCTSSVSDAGWLWNRLLHYWGRGFLPDHALPRLAALLARRVTADHLFHLDAPDQASLPRRYLRRLTYEALLPRARVATMREAVERHLPSLSREVQLA